jgi:hypothetical protein
MKRNEAGQAQLGPHNGAQERATPWPFLYSVVPGVGIVVNVEPESKMAASPPAPKPSKKASAAITRTVVKRRQVPAKKAGKTKAFANPDVTDSALKAVGDAWRPKT